MSGLGIIPGPAPRQQAAFHLSSSSSSSSMPSPQLPLPTAFTSTSSNPPSDEDDDDDDDAPLPFPTALSRRDFLSPTFSAADYLSSLFPGDFSGGGGGGGGLSLRHQTLEDLRTELRERSSAISAELLELVNANYTSFLGLGDTLKGGEERVEDVRVALLGFRRQVEEVQGRVRGRKEEVLKTGGELRGVRGEVEMGRRMLELDERLEVLQGRLEEGSEALDSEDEEEEDEEKKRDGDVDFSGSSPAVLAERAREYLAIDKLADAIGRDVPYIKKMEERITRCRNTLLLDLGTSIKEARKAEEKGRDRVLKLLRVYRQLGAYADGIKTLKEK
ncbi:unnamed protein product [Discula destructiva]